MPLCIARRRGGLGVSAGALWNSRRTPVASSKDLPGRLLLSTSLPTTHSFIFQTPPRPLLSEPLPEEAGRHNAWPPLLMAERPPRRQSETDMSRFAVACLALLILNGAVPARGDVILAEGGKARCVVLAPARVMAPDDSKNAPT